MTLGEIIKEYRSKNGVSMEYVANLCGITKGYVAMLEKNVNSKTGKPVKPTIETIIKVCNGLHLDFDFVFELLDDDYEVTITPSSGFSSIEQKIIYILRRLTPDAQGKVLEYVEDLLASKKYVRASDYEEAEQIAKEIKEERGGDPLEGRVFNDYKKKGLFSSKAKEVKEF